MKQSSFAVLLALAGATVAKGAAIEPSLPVSRAPFERSGVVARQPVQFASWPFFPEPAGAADRSPETWAEFRSGDKTVLANGYDRRVHVFGRTGFGNIVFYRGGTDDFYIDYKYSEPFAREMLAWLEIRVNEGSAGGSASKDPFDDATMAVDVKGSRAGWKRNDFRYALSPAGDGMLALDWSSSTASVEFRLHVCGNSTNGMSGVENGRRIFVNRDRETERIEIAFPDGEAKKTGAAEYVWRTEGGSGRIMIDLCGTTAAKCGAMGTSRPTSVIDFCETDALDVPQDPTGNLLANGSFEQGLAGWEFADGGAAWASVVEEGGGPFERITDEAKCGRRALIFKQNSRPGIQERLQSLPMSLEPGKPYIVSAWIGRAKAEGGPALAEMRPLPAIQKGIVELGKGGKAACSWKIDAGEWKLVEVPFTPKTGDCKIVIGGYGGVIIDAIRVERCDLGQDRQQCVEACLVTSSPDNDLAYGTPANARLELSGLDGAEGAVRVTVRNFYNEIVYRKPFRFKLPETREIALDFDPEKLGTGVFVVGTEFYLGGSRYRGQYQRFSIVRPLDGTHPTANFYVQAPFWERSSNGEKRAAYAKARGMTTTSWERNSRFADDAAPTAQLRKKYGIVARLHCLSSELAEKHPDRFSRRNPQGLMSFTNVVPEKVAFIEREAYEAGLKAAPDDNWWTLWNEEDISLPTIIGAGSDKAKLRAACEAWFPYQEACRRGLKKAFDERGIELKFAPTHGCATYAMDEWRRDMLDNFVDIAAKHGIRYDVAPIHTYYAVDNSCLGRGDRDADAEELLARLDKLGCADTPVMFSEGFNMLPFYMPQWGVRGWGDDYQTGWTASLDLGWREFVHAGAMARLYLMDLKYWPRALTSHTWQHRLTADAAMSPCFWTMVPNTLGRLLPSPKFVGDVKQGGWRAYVFRQGGYGIAAVWTNDRIVELGRKKGMVLNVTLPDDSRFVDLMGNRRAAPPVNADGTSSVPLTPAPLFIVSRDAEELLKAFSSSAHEARIDDGFKNPPKSCALQTWWHWIDDCVTREGISRDLKAMADAGISTAFVFSPKTWTMQPTTETMSGEWLDLFAFAIAEAKKNGIELGFHNCPGWSSSGGPWIAPKDSMKCLVSSSRDIRLGDLDGQSSLALPDPPQKLDFYHDVRLYAFPVKLPPRLVSGKTPGVLLLKKQDSVECVFEYAEPFAPSVAAVDLAAVDFCMAVDVFADEGGKWTRRGGKEYKLYRSQDVPRIVPLDEGAPSRKWKFVFRHIENPAWIPRRDLPVRSFALGDWPYEGARTLLKQDDIVDLGNVVQSGEVEASLLAERLPDSVSETWRIVRVGYTTTATPPAPATIAGLECDKLDRKGLAKHWQNMPERILSLPGADDVVKYVVIDSYEVGKQTWTESLPDEFLRRTGHEIWPALPALLGYRVASAEGVANAAEFDKVIADLYAENYYDYFAELCHAAGVKAVTEPYGGPFDPVRCGKMTDVPTCEFWIGKPLSYSVEKAVSIARTYGKNIVAAESFTTNASEGRWQATPAELRRVGDNAWMAGVNQFAYHSYVHQPYVDRAPGYTLGPHGTQLNVNTTWWPQMRVWSDYVARGQFLLQYGHIVKDRHEIVPGKVEALVREGDGGERIWFVRNKSDAAVRETLALDCATCVGLCEFDAAEGRIYEVAHTPAGVVADLAPGETRFYVFAKDLKGEIRAVTGELLSELSHGWKIAAFSGLAAPDAPMDADALFDWSNSTDERLRHFSGAADYVREGAFPAGILDLGDVREVAEVRVDGVLVGTLAYSPYRIEIPAGKRLEVKVVNTWPNRLIGDARLRERGEEPVTWSNWTKSWGADEELLPAGLLGPVKLYRRDFDIRGFGAVGDGKTLNTYAIQRAIDACAAKGGGRVVIAGGTYVTGTVVLKSGVELHLAEDGILMGSPDWRDWKDQPDAKHIDTYMCPRHRSAALVFADEAEDIAITGPGTIHGNGMAFVEKDPASKSGQLRRRLGLDKSPPRLVLFAGCRRVKVEGVNVLYPPAGWSFWVHDCDEVAFSRVKIFADVDFPNADGIHVNCSRDVKISGCDIETGDDCIVVRANSASLKENKPCERVSVDNCRLRSYSCAVRVGWTNDGVMRDCTFSNLKVRDSVCGIGFFFPAGGDREKLSDQGREASVVENMTFTDIELDGICARPVYVEISPHKTTHVDKIRNIRFVNVSSRGLMLPVVSAPRPGIVSDIFFENCRFDIDPAGKSAYRNGGDVGFARVQRFEDREHGRNIENMTYVKEHGD